MLLYFIIHVILFRTSSFQNWSTKISYLNASIIGKSTHFIWYTIYLSLITIYHQRNSFVDGVNLYSSSFFCLLLFIHLWQILQQLCNPSFLLLFLLNSVIGFHSLQYGQNFFSVAFSNSATLSFKRLFCSLKVSTTTLLIHFLMNNLLIRSNMMFCFLWNKINNDLIHSNIIFPIFCGIIQLFYLCNLFAFYVLSAFWFVYLTSLSSLPFFLRL